MSKTRLKYSSLGIVVVLTGAGALFGLVRGVGPHASPVDAGKGEEVFRDKGCAQCHDTDSTKTKLGPGLLGLFERETLPVSGEPVTEENVRKLLVDPYENMPSYEGRLTDEETDRLIEYLKTL